MAATLLAAAASTKQLLQCQKTFLPSVRTYGKARPKIKRSKPFVVPKVQTVAKIESTAASLAARGFLRSVKGYEPPEDVNTKFNELCGNIFGVTNNHFALSDEEKRAQLLFACNKEFQYKVPNSILHTMKTLGDVRTFYNTRIISTTPLDTLKNSDLPPNLCIETEYHRFDPETDTMFGGISAFPKSSTIVTGLRYKGKYKGHKSESPWRDTF